MKRRETGRRGEKLAADFLTKRGYRILETNYRCHYGEIDLVARYQDFLVFIEVRTKKSPEFGSPEESITQAKKEHLIVTAQHYQQEHDNLPPSWRIDVVALEMDRRGQPLRMALVENAVTED